MVIQGGGPVATALTALARWGMTCAMCGVIGSDRFGSSILASLSEEDIITDGVLVRKGFDSQFAFIACEPGSGRRTIFWRRPTGPVVEPSEINYALLENARIVHIDGLFMDASFAACRVARQRGIPVVIDAGTLREGMLDLARMSDYFIASESFARSLAGADDPLIACRLLADLGPRVAGVTLGAKGYAAIAGNRIITKPAFRVAAVDTTGCGDVFHAGVTYGVLRGWDIEKTLEFAAWAAAMVSLRIGGRAGIPTGHELMERGYG